MTASKKSRGKAHTSRINNWTKTNQDGYWRDIDNCHLDEEIITYIAGVGVLVIVCMVMAVINI